jgi:exodeoxyribonuclease V alpha subunit
MDNISQIQGVVNDIISINRDPRNPKVIFKLKTSEGKDYKVDCPFFCPISIGDGFYGVGKILDVNNVVILKPPFVAIPVDKDNIMQFFLKTLKGTKFGAVSAGKLYDEFEKLAQEFKFGKKFESEAASETTEGSSKQYNAITPESRYYGDGVIAFLTEYAAEYCTNKNEKVITMIAGKTINKPQTKKLLEEWHNKRSFRRLYLLGLTRTEILSSGKNLEELYKICLTNPYKVPSVQFDKCEKILSTVGKIPTDEQKDCGRINRFVYSNANEKGWICTPDWIVRKSFPKYDTYKELLQKEYELIEVKEKVYITYHYRVEMTVATYTNSLIEDTAISYSKKTPSLVSNTYECKTLTEEQKKAVQGALNSRISVVTGGAGVGKSLCIREIARNLSIRGVSYVVAAFTGKAVSRLHEIMRNKNATTIDRLIMKIKERTINDDSYDKTHIKHVIIDEVSMVTTELFYRLISQLNHKVSFTFIGDQNQLPPIGCGFLMKELMNCGRIPIFYLTKNQRILPINTHPESGSDPGSQSYDRAILDNANALIDPTRNKSVAIKYKEGAGFYIFEGSKETVKSLLTELKKANIDKDKIVILSPYKAPLFELNSIFQNVYFGDSIDSENSYMQPTPAGARLWCIGDRVMMTANNYKINVMNGEQGKVVGIEDAGIKVEFEDEAQHLFKFSTGDEKLVDLEDVEEDSKTDQLYTEYLSHSFSVSIHKSQGSEYDYVILYIPEDKSFSSFLNINLLYTAITRTKRSIWVISSKTTLEKISTTMQPTRFDGLSGLLRTMKNEVLEKELTCFTTKPEIEAKEKTSTALTAIHESFDSYEDNEY